MPYPPPWNTAAFRSIWGHLPRLADKPAWTALRDAMVPVIDAQYGVYVKNKAGEWSFSQELFEAYSIRHGIDWPRLETGKLNLKRKTFETMSKGWPQLEELRQLRHARDKMRKINLAVGSDGRNRTVLWPFQSKTSRTQPKAAQWIFSPAVWLRSLIKPGPGMAVAYIDYSSMEFLLAAALSENRPGKMLELYLGRSVSGLCQTCRRRAAGASKKTHEALRERYKVALLAIQYGMTAETLAVRLGISSFEAHEMLAQHHALFAVYWQWSDDWLARALDTGSMQTVLVGSAAPASPSSTSARCATGQFRPPARRSCALPAFCSPSRDRTVRAGA